MFEPYMSRYLGLSKKKAPLRSESTERMNWGASVVQVRVLVLRLGSSATYFPTPIISRFPARETTEFPHCREGLRVLEFLLRYLNYQHMMQIYSKRKLPVLI